MTCLIGLEEEGRAWIGADGRNMSGWWGHTNQTYPKLFKKGRFIVGSTGSIRFLQIVEYLVDFSESTAEAPEFMVATVAEEIRKKCKEVGYSIIDNNYEHTEDSLLIGYNSNIYWVSSNFSVTGAPEDGLITLGSGGDFASGAMKALIPYLDPVNRILRSLEIASKFSTSVGQPFKVMEVD